jgi:hypothetical protein
MSESSVQDEAGPVERRSTVRLSRSSRPALAEMLRRVVPDAVEDDGVARLDVCAFNSGI